MKVPNAPRLTPPVVGAVIGLLAVPAALLIAYGLRYVFPTIGVAVLVSFVLVPVLGFASWISTTIGAPSTQLAWTLVLNTAFGGLAWPHFRRGGDRRSNAAVIVALAYLAMLAVTLGMFMSDL